MREEGVNNNVEERWRERGIWLIGCIGSEVVIKNEILLIMSVHIIYLVVSSPVTVSRWEQSRAQDPLSVVAGSRTETAPRDRVSVL